MDRNWLFNFFWDHFGLLNTLYLAGDGECVAQLGFPRPKLSKHLCDGTRLNPTCRRAKRFKFDVRDWASLLLPEF